MAAKPRMQPADFSYVPTLPIFVEGVGADDIALFLSMSRNYRLVRLDKQDIQVARHNLLESLKEYRGVVVIGFFGIGRDWSPKPEELEALKKARARVVSLRRGVRYNLPTLFWDVSQPAATILNWVDSR